jgi:hypothetical protein
MKAGFIGQGIVIHELAHIAVDRFALFKTKDRRNSSHRRSEKESNTAIALLIGSQEFDGGDPHGGTFQRAWGIMLERAKKYASNALSEEIIELTEIALMRYEVGYRQSSWERRLLKDQKKGK